MKLIYVAGKYSAGKDGKEWSGIEDNIRHAEQVSLKLLQAGWAVITPHKNTAHYELFEDMISFDHKKWLDVSLEILIRCDAIFLMNNWEDSKGTRIEYDMACERGIPIFRESAGIPTPDELEE